jgi:hypothetical protein
MRKLQVVRFVILFCSVPMMGQSGKAELFGGYSLERIAGGCGTDYRCNNNTGATTNLNGWTASITGDVFKSFGLSAHFSGNYGNAGFGGGGGGFATVHRYAYQVGPAYTFRWQRTSAFTHALLGGVTQGISQASPNGVVQSYTSFLWSLGGGLDIKLSNRLSVRAAQIDYERHNVPADANASNQSASPTSGFRYSAGIVLRLGVGPGCK